MFVPAEIVISIRSSIALLTEVKASLIFVFASLALLAAVQKLILTDLVELLFDL